MNFYSPLLPASADLLSSSPPPPPPPPPPPAPTIDSTTVARFSAPFAGSGPKTITSDSFTAPDGALLVLCCAVDNAENPAAAVSVADSGGLTWTLQAEQTGPIDGFGSITGWAQIWTAKTVSAVSRTVSVTRSSFNGSALSAKVYIVTGQHATSPIGASNNGLTTANDFNATLTSTGASAVIFAVALDWTATGTPTSADMDYYSADTFPGSMSCVDGYKFAPTVGAQTVDIDGSGASAADWRWAVLEILPAEGTATYAPPPIDYRRASFMNWLVR